MTDEPIEQEMGDLAQPQLPDEVIEECKEVSMASDDAIVTTEIAQPIPSQLVDEPRPLELEDLLSEGADPQPCTRTNFDTRPSEPVPADAAPMIRPPIEHKEFVTAADKGIGRRQNMYLRQIPLCPTFEPTMEEFTKFTFCEYLAECEKYLEPHIGCFKVSYIV